ncbi:protein-tyrosine phosphatase [Staphylococcus hominis]|jgi:protein-tyrosine phosphatase|uniref:low molecular weight protein-tyrosine-phosphatase n=1 Tax=Staphylococcus TaxID=1279 RepID=UPI00024E1EE1|nr:MULTISPECIES: low molecular weight protein-tyrosine-phosphatase [Staphylococcus]EHR90573.1 low molecular weight protein-tyrosine-phosphatase PtpA [Staphylococcus hominis VCU122]MBB4833804.1 protein-tyrosine phosphatase [Staphylococcus hominis]MCC3711936.1 low molecular weight phosphotyrosine protein phosphatase [Staphylococcus hominis]MCC3714338.1 low molecular weight phosphotyrosine protein phosphatase [Staphylococcus hominis]MCC3737706.1 low molecular weight phosphotyrosine protein phosph
MVDVAFVCLGNICRSTMAEAIMRQRLKERGISDVIVHSRGTGRWNLGEPPHQGTQKILKQHHIPFDGIVSELFEPDDDFDYIIAMDQSNVNNIKSINPNLKGQLFKLLEFSNMEETDVPDPYYTNNFEGVYDMVQSSCDNLIDFIVKDANLKEG